MSGDLRKSRILDAAVAEFARRGYEPASTNAIAEAAGVAKGLVFHHFRTKEALFLAAAEHVIDRTVARFFEASAPLPADLFERLHRWALLKLRVFEADPDGFRFLTRTVTQAPPEVRSQVDKLYGALLAKHWPRFLEGIDTTRFAAGLRLEDAVETLSLLAEGLERRMAPLLLDGPPGSAHAMMQSAWKHFERLRDGLYRRG